VDALNLDGRTVIAADITGDFGSHLEGQQLGGHGKLVSAPARKVRSFFRDTTARNRNSILYNSSDMENALDANAQAFHVSSHVAMPAMVIPQCGAVLAASLPLQTPCSSWEWSIENHTPKEGTS
jgi:hypothetical protein